MLLKSLFFVLLLSPFIISYVNVMVINDKLKTAELHGNTTRKIKINVNLVLFYGEITRHNGPL